MKFTKILTSMALAAAVAGCSSDSTNNPADAPPSSADAKPSGGPDSPAGFQQPAGTVAVNFTVDDTANKVYTQGNLQWKGSMIFDPATRKVTKDTTWGGPWAPLYDDGPWTAGGHEPVGAVAGDHKWGVTVFATPPATGMDTYEYGLNDDAYQTSFGNGWVWIGSNGTFNVAAGATAAVSAQGQTFPAFGTVDLQLTIDTHALDNSTAWDTSKVGVKGSAWAWGVQNLTIDGTGKATFTLSAFVGSGKPFSHTGLVNSGDTDEFIFVFGSGATPKEYKDASGNALKTGVTAGVKKSGAGSFSNVDISVLANKNTAVTIPN